MSNTQDEDMKAELSFHAYNDPPVTDLEMVGMSEFHKENRNTETQKRRRT